MTSHQNIVITGLGIVSPIGIGQEPFWTALCEGRSGIRSLPMCDDPTLPVPIGGVVADFDPKQYVRPRKSLKIMNRDIQLGFAAADLACVDSQLQAGTVDPERLGVLLGTDMMACDLDELIGTYVSCTVDGRFDFSRWGQACVAELFPLWMLKYLPNMPACHIGIAQDARGPNNSVTLGEVSTLSAFGEALRVLHRGQADMMIAGGVSSRSYSALWPRLQVIGQSQRFGDPEGASRPFDAERDGVVYSEGAAAAILEDESRAKSRGAKVFARVLGHAFGFEPHGKGQPLTGSAIRRVILAALDAAGKKPDDIGFVTAHGSSRVDDDRIEAQAIRDTLGDVPVTAPKSCFGYLGAGSGSLDIMACALALHHEQVPPTRNYEHPDPQCPINVVHGQPAPLGRPNGLILSHSRNGQAVAIVLGKA